MSERDLELRRLANEEVEKHKDTVESDPYRLKYHHMPPVGLLNDPNGFIQWKGTYHLFYQWMPFDTGHGAKFWGHYASEDLVKWRHEPIALTPSDWFDKNGVYSGSAVVHDDELYLFYTGNVKDENDNREAYQCIAVSQDGVHFEKQGVAVNLPEGYTPHFRDPKVWKKADHWYMVIGAQSEDLQGKVVMFQSSDLKNWELMGPVTGSGEGTLGSFGYMWECPDLFALGGKDILIVSPQGLEPQGMNYANTYQSGYFAGALDYNTGKLEHEDFRELDRGFEFYAPQTTLDEQGRRLLFGWMGVPDQYEQAHPTIEYQWVHCMTLPRELTWNGTQIIQKPAEELKQMRGPVLLHSSITINNDQKAIRGIEGKSVEWNLEFEKIEDQFAIELFQYASLSYKDGVLTLSRPHLEDKTKTEFRRVALEQGLKSMRLYVDHSSLEVFINEGEEVMTSRIFPQPEEEHILFTSLGESTFSIEQWKLDGFQHA
ncbi:sucrose-6-phosphate hydrolase [Halobacillus sp. ACCC02827]|uniref:glycoside hydrolase family 32 protein n=1 Tax=Halobacillus sp. ACCC02827 TaxID=3052090 RepID=UPI0025708B63|nr:sucrose-6-phosphate hydrolase [Halobacillus sp. ACCC02827]WJE15499.1 sucrose-6-phosphate hydrolase [Halobacillus sp. ACCC02827]